MAALCVALIGGVAWAQSAEALARDGEELARVGRIPEAIALFKRADALEPRASHACLIGLAYLRRERWAQAELYFGQCRERTPESGSLPDWLVLAERQLDDRLREANVAAVEILVDPTARLAKLSVSSFAPDEQFAPRRIFLPFGRHVVTASAPGHTRVQTLVTITDRSPRRVSLRFASEPTTPSRAVPWTITAVGGSAILAGALYHALAFKPVRESLETASDPRNPNQEAYDRASSEFDRRRNITLGLYGVGVAAVVTGVTLRFTMFRNVPESAVRVSARLHAGGAVVGVEWRR